MSLYEEIGGEASVDAALDKFYPKILGDARVSFLFALPRDPRGARRAPAEDHGDRVDRRGWP